jgi:error-prone DNA polymerase
VNETCLSNTPLPYASVRDLWLRTSLPVHVIERLANAGAFGSLGLTRRQALWAAKALGRVGDQEDDLPLFNADAAPPPPARPPECDVTRGVAGCPVEHDPEKWIPVFGKRSCSNKEVERDDDSKKSHHALVAPEPTVALPRMRPGEEVVHDYRFLELTLRAHPASFLRADLDARGIIRNEALRTKLSGTRVSVSGLVTIRQRPGSANGVIFMTIEDETAVANIIVWPKTFERFRPIVLGARYVAVSGPLQQESGVIHVVAVRIDDLTPLLARLTADAPPIEQLARADAVKRPHDENVDSRARGRRNPPRLAAPAALPDLLGDQLASDLDVPARGSAHAPARRGGSRAGRR